MERRKRTYMHKGKLRFKYRVPRKLKKKRKKMWKKNMDKYTTHLKKLHGDDWWNHIIMGG